MEMFTLLFIALCFYLPVLCLCSGGMRNINIDCTHGQSYTQRYYEIETKILVAVLF